MLDSTLYTDLKPVAVRRLAPRSAPRRGPARPVQRRHMSLGAARDRAAVARATSRVAHTGHRSTTPTSFNACL